MSPAGDPSAQTVRVDLDARRHRFLRDHLVAGRPLLSTVMGIEVMAGAVRSARSGTETGSGTETDAVTDIEVGPPFFLPASGSGHVDVVVSPGSGPVRRCEVWSGWGPDGAGTRHYSADVGLAGAAGPGPAAPPVARPVPVRRPTDPVVGAADIYALFFHGESFQVVRSAYRRDDVMVGELVRGLPPISEPPRATITAPLLNELCLQTAGLWELAAHDRMTIPHHIDRVTRYTGADSTQEGGTEAEPLWAVVTPRPDGGDGVVFDAVVIDVRGSVHVAVEGYRTTAFTAPYDRAAAARIRAALGWTGRTDR